MCPNTRRRLFDIVNVQNWPAACAPAGAVVPVARSLSIAGAQPLTICDFLLVGWVELLRDPTLWCQRRGVGSRKLDPTYGKIFAGLAQTAERRPRNAEVACSIHAAGSRFIYRNEAIVSRRKAEMLALRPITLVSVALANAEDHGGRPIAGGQSAAATARPPQGTRLGTRSMSPRFGLLLPWPV